MIFFIILKKIYFLVNRMSVASNSKDEYEFNVTPNEVFFYI